MLSACLDLILVHRLTFWYQRWSKAFTEDIVSIRSGSGTNQEGLPVGAVEKHHEIESQSSNNVVELFPSSFLTHSRLLSPFHFFFFFFFFFFLLRTISLVYSKQNLPTDSISF
ncbi:hypothetical protein N656DRAFT_56676 [Canariomyces notabilis]|uniref:Uncharacterized protein n=1 Tax=Canariomyces notabilis TaxID=2074819 RepID=A0AAN6YXG3_9PEZI|nr:hypothetical protein N656DRAFT_56676 [Canariomyces arenarius]